LKNIFQTVPSVYRQENFYSKNNYFTKMCNSEGVTGTGFFLFTLLSPCQYNYSNAPFSSNHLAPTGM